MRSMAAEIRRTADHDEAGRPGDPLLVLLHGSVVTRTIWRPQLERLGDTVHVLAPDLPGHGSRAQVPFSFAACVDEIDRLIQQHGGHAVVAGLSLGGYAAMLLAARHPERVSGLVLCGATVNFTGMLGAYLKGVSWLMARGWLTPGARTLERKTRALFPPLLADLADQQIRDGLYAAPLATAFAEMARTDFCATLAAYDGPVLILNGERDRPARKGEAAFARAARRARVQTVAGARHACSLDAPDAVAAALRAFVNEVSPAAALR
jgi:pimeloyl-ACP methyl ester carboxylesterase